MCGSVCMLLCLYVCVCACVCVCRRGLACVHYVLTGMLRGIINCRKTNLLCSPLYKCRAVDHTPFPCLLYLKKYKSVAIFASKTMRSTVPERTRMTREDQSLLRKPREPGLGFRER